MNASSPMAEPVTLQELWQILWGRRRLVAGCTLSGALIALAAALLMTPVYRAEVLLSPTSAEQDSGALSALAGQYGGLAALAGISLGGTTGDRRTEAVATLKSRALTESFVAELNLLPVLFADRWDARAGRWKSSDPDEQPTLWDANRLFAQTIRSVDEDKKTGLVTLGIEWTQPEQCAAWATELVRRTNLLLRTRAIERAERNIDYLRQQLEQTSIVEVRQAIYRLVENEIKTIMLAQGSEEYAFKVLDPAVVPEEKVRPKRLLILALGVAGGFGLGCLGALLLGASRGAA